MVETMKGLKAELAASIAETKSYQEKWNATRGELADTKQLNKQLHAQFADLKERLATAEAENQRMRGYIQRVQEDDTVREELVATGDPTGEQTMVPKRKPTSFDQPPSHSNLGEIDTSDRFYRSYENEQRRKPIHWIRY